MPHLSRPRTHIAFVELTEGDVDPAARSVCESTLFARLDAAGVAADMVAINASGCFFSIDERDSARVRAVVTPLNAALRLRAACARVTLVRGEADWPLPSLGRVLAEIAAVGLAVVHITAGASAVDVIVDGADAGRAAQVLSTFCGPAGSRRVA